MLTISPLKIGQYQSTKSINKTNNNYHPINALKNNIGEYSYPAIYFMGSIDKITRPPINKKTKEKLNSVYENYQNKLYETTPKDIENICNEIEENYHFPQKDILKAMQLVTQFGNIESLKNIANSMNENDIGLIPHNGWDFKLYTQNKKNLSNIFDDNFGLNSSLYYCFLKKEIQNLDGDDIGILIDSNKLEDLENLSEKELENINKEKHIKFFILSGFENGVNFIDRTKDLKTQTINLLNYSKEQNLPIEESVDDKIIKRCKNIGINPIIVKNSNEATINNIYNQLKPKQISKQELTAVLDAAAINTFKEQNKQVECVNGLTQYLENTLEVYTPERISKELKNINSEINKQVKLLDKTPEDVIYIIPESGKSYDLINYQYQKINNIPKKQFITLTNENSFKNINAKNKVFVILDDCSLSGTSFLEDENFNYFSAASQASKNNNNIIFAAIYISEKAEDRINKNIKMKRRINQDYIIKTNKNEKNWDDNINNDINKSYLNKALGKAGWSDSKYCIIFPYMSPDNNSEFASNIAIFHNINYSKDNKNINNYVALNNIKTFYDDPIKVHHLVNQILNEEQK